MCQLSTASLLEHVETVMWVTDLPSPPAMWLLKQCVQRACVMNSACPIYTRQVTLLLCMCPSGRGPAYSGPIR